MFPHPGSVHLWEADGSALRRLLVRVLRQGKTGEQDHTRRQLITWNNEHLEKNTFTFFILILLALLQIKLDNTEEIQHALVRM